MSAWETAIAFVLRWEAGGDPDGGLTQDPLDPGGTTRWGLSQRSHPELDLLHLTREQAEAIYRVEYWTRLRAAEMPAPVAVALMDWAVHSGVRFAARRLQRVLGVALDGIVGDATIAALAGRDAFEVALALTIARARHQGSLLQGNPSLVRFAGGWGARLCDLTATFSRLPG